MFVERTRIKSDKTHIETKSEKTDLVKIAQETGRLIILSQKVKAGQIISGIYRLCKRIKIVN